MIKQTLMFTTPVSLSLKDQQMVITFKDNKDTVTRPILGKGKREKSTDRPITIGIILVNLLQIIHILTTS